MFVKRWDKLPEDMQNEAMRPYYKILRKKALSLIIKRLFDIVMSIVLLVLLSPVFLIVSIFIKSDSKGPIFYRQERVTQYGKVFRIFKFRTMVQDSDKLGALITINNDTRVTKIGKKLRKYRLDEIPQLLNILSGDMTFVGTRPEVPKYVNCYTDEMKATLLLPAGVTSEASIYYKDENCFLDDIDNIDKIYKQEILPGKMKYNLRSIKRYGFWNEIGLMFKTILTICEKL